MADPPQPAARSEAPASTASLEHPDALARLNAAAPTQLVQRARRARLVGERKPVTAVFADIVGSTALAERIDPEDWTLIINAAFDELSQCIFRFEGTIAQLQGDAIISFFGAPVAHEDDPERAVRAALAMIDAMRSYGDEVRSAHGIEFQIRVGVCTGPVLVGNVGSDLRYDYTAIGDTMNLASRLQSAAPPGGILISDRTARYVGPIFELEDVGPLELKGKSEAVQAYRVKGERARPGPTRGVQGLSSPMVGRDDELAALIGLASAARAGLGRVALVLGEPGLGKSRLLGEMHAALEREDAASEGHAVAWVAAHASSHRQRDPFHLLSDLILDVLGVGRGSTPGEIEAALRDTLARLAPDDPEAHQYLAALLGSPLDAAEAALVERTSGDLLQERIVAAVLRILKRSAQGGPMVIVIEDLHWADAATAEALPAMFTLVEEAPVVIVLTSREEPESPGWSVVGTARDRIGRALTEVVLRPLEQARTRELVANLLEIESLPEQTRELILRKSEGNPLFVEEVIRMLIERGAIERKAERWVATTAVSRMEIPDTVHGLILSRIDRQPPEARRVLRLASCIDRQFAVPLLADVSLATGDGHDLGAALGRLEAADLILLAATVPEVEYRFSHALIQDAAYDSVLRQERRDWHLRIGEALLAHYPERETELAVRLARHFEEAGEAARAIHYLMVAARHGMMRNALVDARSLIARAQALLPDLAEPGSDDARRLRLRVTMGAIATDFMFARTDATARLVEEAEELADSLGDVATLADAVFWEILLRWAAGGRPETDDRLAAALERRAALGDVGADEVQRALILYQTGLIQWLTGEFPSSLDTLRQAVPIMERNGDVVGAAMAEGFMAVDYASMGDFDQAEERIEAARRHAEGADKLSLLDYQLAEASIAAERGDYATSRRFAGDCFTAATEMGALACASIAGIVLGASEMGIGDAGQARLSLERSLELAAQGYLAPIRQRANVFLASVAGMSGDLARAETAFHVALEGFAAQGNPYGEAEAQLLRGLVLATHPDGDPAEALRTVDGARTVFERHGARPSLARAHRARALALRRLGRLDEASEAFAAAATLAGQMGLLDGPWPASDAEFEAARVASSPIQPA